MTSSDRPVPEPESERPDEPPPTTSEPTCRIIYRTPEPFTIEDATRMLAGTTAACPSLRVPLPFPLSNFLVSEGSTSVDGCIGFHFGAAANEAGHPARMNLQPSCPYVE
jgi:hypothetical protein